MIRNRSVIIDIEAPERGSPMLDQQTASRAKNLLESIRAYDDAMVSWLGNYFYKDNCSSISNINY